MVYMKRRLGYVSLFGISFLFLIYVGIQIGRKQEVGPVEVKENTRTIAIVNMDQGIRMEQGVTNYGTQMINLSTEHFHSTSLEEARSGIETGKYAAYIIIPTNFSEKVWSINTTPEKSTLEYAINPNLQEGITLDVLYDIKGFEMTLNTDISYLYLYSILQEFHTGQASAETIMKNDKRDLENLNAIIPEELLQPLVFVELQPYVEYPDDINLNTRYRNIDKAMEELGSQYDTYISWAEEDLDGILEKGKIVTEAMEGFHATISDINLLEDEDGNLIYKEGKETFFEELAGYNVTLEEERAAMIEKFQWLAQRDSIATPSEATPSQATPSEAGKNTWLDEIRAEHERQKEEYNQRLEEWRDSFDYSMLASPSNANRKSTRKTAKKASTDTDINHTKSIVNETAPIETETGKTEGTDETESGEGEAKETESEDVCESNPIEEDETEMGEIPTQADLRNTDFVITEAVDLEETNILKEDQSKDDEDQGVIKEPVNQEPVNATVPSRVEDTSMKEETGDEVVGDSISSTGENTDVTHDNTDSSDTVEETEQDEGVQISTPSEATPSEPDPPEDNHEWLIDRDYNMVTLALDGIYEKLEEELEDLSLDEDQLDEVMWIVWQACNDEDIIRPIVVSASNASPVTGNPDADIYIREFFNSIPLYEDSLTDELDIISDQIVEFCTRQIEYLEGRSAIPLDWLDGVFEEVFIGKLAAQEVFLQEGMGKSLDEFGETFEDFNVELQAYNPLHSRDEDDLNQIESNIQGNISKIQDDVNEKTGTDREYISTLVENQSKDITSLQENLDLSYEGTARNLEEALNRAKDNRKQLNNGNENLLYDFTRKLPYTRNGSVAATNTYDVIVNPVSFQEKAVKKKPLVINGQEIHIGVELLWGVFIIATILLSIQNAYLRKKNKQLKEDIER